MLENSLIISYATPNYTLANNYLATLHEIDFPESNICHFLDTNTTPSSDNDCRFGTDFFYLALKNRFKNLINVLESNINNNIYQYFIACDCDIWFIKENKNKWNDLKVLIDNGNKDFYFMREDHYQDVNCGFFIIKNNANFIKNIDFLKDIYQNMITLDSKDMVYAEQSLINKEKHKISYDYIPQEYYIWANNLINKDMALFHHPVCCDSVNTKQIQINNIKQRMQYS